MMVQRKERVQILLSENQENITLAASIHVSSTEARAIDTILERKEQGHLQ